MRRQVYRFCATLLIMLLYLSVTVASDVVSLTCQCKCNHQADVHTSFAHTHSCDCESECHYVQDNCQGCQPVIDGDDCHCQHNHSTEIKLYTQTRNAADDDILRSLMLWAVVAYVVVDVEIDAAATGVTSFNRYLLLPLLGAHNRGVSMRAPPVLV